ncbi:MAG: helix-turn-helix domain-containing protein [Anderseniella sp.]|nr:helix-turn-helix domain-containing protein [Anderseniella sp.]
MDIGEVIARSGLPASTLRFYEDKRLIQPIGRNGLRRIYDTDVLDRLSLIALGQDAGFTLEEIAGMFTSDGAKIDRKQLAAQADKLDGTIKHLIAMRDGLRHASQCSAPSHLECDKFQRLLAIALKSRRRRKTRQQI